MSEIIEILSSDSEMEDIIEENGELHEVLKERNVKLQAEIFELQYELGVFIESFSDTCKFFH